MKKRLTLLICALLTAILAFSTSCANTDLSKFMPSFEIHNNLATLSLTKDDFVQDCDEFGLMIIENYTYDEEDNLVSTKQRLYNSRTDAFIEGAESVVLEDSEPANDALSVSISAGIYYLTDGMYALATMIGERATAEEVFDVKVKVELFGKNGKAGEAEFDEAVMLNNPYNDETKVFTDWSGVRYYVNTKGNLVKENDVFARILSYHDANYYVEMYLDNYYAVMSENGIEFYDLDGKFIRAEDVWFKMGLTENISSEPEIWTIGDFIFVQYSLVLSDDAKNYDYQERYVNDIDEEKFRKMDLVTKRYDVKEGKIKDMNMDVIVTDDYGMSGIDSEVLYYYEIIDKQIGMYELVQIFDKDLKVSLDIQKLVPGAYSVEFSFDSMFIWSSAGMSVLKGKEIVKVFPSGIDVDGNSIIVEHTPTALDIYDLNGQLKKSYTDILDVETGWGINETLILTFGNSIVEYDLQSHSERILASFDDETVRLKSVQAYYIATESAGDDGDFNTVEDNIINIRFLIDGIADVQLQYNDVLDIEVLGSYYDYNKETSCQGMIVRVEIYDGETDEVTVTYYRSEYVVAYEAEGK